MHLDWVVGVVLIRTLHRGREEHKEQHCDEFFHFTFPQGLKPGSICWCCGTTKVVPFQSYNDEYKPSDEPQFSAECNPPAPARNSTLALSPSGDWPQFHRQAPQWTHFSRSKSGTPSSPLVMAWPLHMAMQVFSSHVLQRVAFLKAT